MPQIDENQIPNEDAQLIEKYRLGHPRKVYRSRPRSLSFAYVIRLLVAIGYTSLFIVGFILFVEQFPMWSWPLRAGVGLMFILLATGILGRIPRWNILSKIFLFLSIVSFIVIVVLVQSPAWTLLSRVGVGLTFLLFALGTTEFINLYSGWSRHLIVCEAGMLEVIKGNREDTIHVMYWKDILVQKSYFVRERWRIIEQTQKPLGILASAISVSDYQNGDELLALIREQITERDGER